MASRLHGRASLCSWSGHRAGRGLWLERAGAAGRRIPLKVKAIAELSGTFWVRFSSRRRGWAPVGQLHKGVGDSMSSRCVRKSCGRVTAPVVMVMQRSLATRPEAAGL